jgi:hypothetical protein
VKLIGGVGFVKIIRGTNGWFVVCIGNMVENRSKVVCERVNG